MANIECENNINIEVGLIGKKILSNTSTSMNFEKIKNKYKL